MRRPSSLPRGMRRLRIFMLICLSLVGVPVSVARARAHECLVFVGTYTGKGSEGIYAYGFSPTTGESVSIGVVASTTNPSFLVVDPRGKFLYAVNELDTFEGKPTGAVSAFAIDRASGALKLLQQVSSLGKGPAHLSLDSSARYLLVANYGSGSHAVFPVGNDGRLGSHSAFVQNSGSSVNPQRQAGPHTHSIQVTADNRLVIVADLGLDKLLLYRFDDKTGFLTPGRPEYVKLEPGAGPRHVALAPAANFVYTVNELASTITVFAYDAGAGTLHQRETVSTLPKTFTGESTAAEAAVDAGGKFLYASNRGADSIAVFSIHTENGSLTPVEWVPSGGKSPRHFAIDPTGQWLFVANQKSDEITLFKIDPNSGRLTPTSQSLKVVSPVCVCIVHIK